MLTSVDGAPARAPAPPLVFCKIPPERIQQVKDHKKLLKEVAALKSTCKESAAKAQVCRRRRPRHLLTTVPPPPTSPPADYCCLPAQAAYASTSSTMDVWLEGVDLPLLGTKSYDPRSLPVCANPATGPCIRDGAV